jgi:CspA family cold shock protein
MLSGVIKSWNAAKGYGFITDDNDQDLFVHANDLDLTLKPSMIFVGMRVKFDVQSDIKGDKAKRVRQE